MTCGTRVNAIQPLQSGSSYRLEVSASGPKDDPLRFPADLVLVSVGVRPDSKFATFDVPLSFF